MAIIEQAGRISVGGNGQPIEYAVKMRHLPQEAMLNNLLVRDKVTPEMLASVAKKLAEFHAKAETGAA